MHVVVLYLGLGGVGGGYLVREGLRISMKFKDVEHS